MECLKIILLIFSYASKCIKWLPVISDIGFLKGVTRISETQAKDNAVRFCEACSLIVRNGIVYGFKQPILDLNT